MRRWIALVVAAAMSLGVLALAAPAGAQSSWIPSVASARELVGSVPESQRTHCQLTDPADARHRHRGRTVGDPRDGALLRRQRLPGTLVHPHGFPRFRESLLPVVRRDVRSGGSIPRRRRPVPRRDQLGFRRREGRRHARVLLRRVRSRRCAAPGVDGLGVELSERQDRGAGGDRGGRHRRERAETVVEGRRRAAVASGSREGPRRLDRARQTRRNRPCCRTFPRRPEGAASSRT